MCVYEQYGRFWNFGKNEVEYCKQSIMDLSRKTLEGNNAKSYIKSEGPAQEVSGGNLTTLLINVDHQHCDNNKECMRTILKSQ